MNAFAASCIFTVFCTVILGIFVYLQGRKKIVNKLWGLCSIAISLWSLGLFGTVVAQSKIQALYWQRVLYIGTISIPFLFFHYICALLNCIPQKKRVIISGYLIGFFFLLINFTQYFIAGIAQKTHFNYWPIKPGILYYPFLVVFFVFITYSHFLLYKEYTISGSDRRNRIKYMLFAAIVGFGGGSTNFLLDFDIGMYPFGNFFVVLYSIIMTYAILRHQLLDIEVIVKKTFVFAGLLTSVFAILILPTLLIQGYLLRGVGTSGRLIGLTISGIIIILTMRRIETFLVNVTDKYLFQKKYDYKELLKTFTTEVLTVLDMDKLVNLTIDKLSSIMRLESCNLVLFDPEENGRDAIKKINSELTLPIELHNEIIGALALGKKKSDEDYTQDDLDILLPLARTLAIAISNAKLFVELGKTQAEAAQREKMAVIGTLSAGMAHEIRNPITTIKVFTEFLKEKKDDPEFIKKFEHLVPKEVDKINTMITNLLEFSSPADYKSVESVDIKEAVKDVLEILENELVLNDIVFEDNMIDVAPVRGNRKYIQEILFNLIQNAVQAIGRRGRIIVEAEEIDDSVVVSIKDTGCGISEENMKNLFQPFFTTKLNSKGVGLGLYVIKQLMLRMNGNITVESEVGKGSRFRLCFLKAGK